MIWSAFGLTEKKLLWMNSKIVIEKVNYLHRNRFEY